MTAAQITAIPLGNIRAGDNDRKVFVDAEIASLGESILALGLIQPITVRPTGSTPPYEIVTGERRYRAHLHAGLPTIDAIIDTTISDEKASARMLAENTARVGLSIMEEAQAYAKRAAAGVPIDQIAKDAGVARFRVDWRLSLLDLIPECAAAVETEVLPAGPALEVAKLDPNRQAVALRAWMKNPNMGAFVFRDLCAELAKAAVEDGSMFMFETEEWIEQAAAAKPLRKADLIDLVGRMAAALAEAGYDGPLINEAASVAKR